MSEPMYVVWVCEAGDSRLRPRGKPLTDACGNPNIMRSTLTNGNRKKRWMGVCKQCGRKRSLNRGIIRDFDTREGAEKYVSSLGELE